MFIYMLVTYLKKKQREGVGEGKNHVAIKIDLCSTYDSVYSHISIRHIWHTAYSFVKF